MDKYHRSYIQCLKDELVPVIPKQAIVNIIKQTNVSGKENSKPDFSLVLIIFFDLQLNAPRIK